ncbi:hypothetical protein [Caudoviricetes sp.]|nr:hypothetical protein [Caudoviricetes sp.]
MQFRECSCIPETSLIIHPSPCARKASIMTKSSDLLHLFTVNQIVLGRFSGVFVILGFRIIDEEWYAQLKGVNPTNHGETSPGELALPLTSIRAFQKEA